MTSHNSLRPTPPIWVHVLRCVLIALLLCGAVAGSLYLHAYTLPELAANITDAEANPGFPSSAEGIVHWLTEEIGLLLPFLTVLLLPFFIYRKIDRHDGKAQKEMVYALVLVALFVYAVLLPYTTRLSDAQLQSALAAGEEFPILESGAHDTLLLSLIPWFIRLGIGLAILALYHSMRAQREADAYRKATAGVTENSPSAAPVIPSASEAVTADDTTSSSDEENGNVSKDPVADPTLDMPQNP